MLQRVKGFRLPLTCLSYDVCCVLYVSTASYSIIFKHSFDGCQFVLFSSPNISVALSYMAYFFPSHGIPFGSQNSTQRLKNFNVPNETSKVLRTFSIRFIHFSLESFNHSAIHSIF